MLQNQIRGYLIQMCGNWEDFQEEVKSKWDFEVCVGVSYGSGRREGRILQREESLFRFRGWCLFQSNGGC